MCQPMGQEAFEGMWMGHHLIGGFSYLGLRVIFTLGPSDESTRLGAELLVGAKLVPGFVRIALGVAGDGYV